MTDPTPELLVQRTARPLRRRAVLRVTSEQIAALLHLPDDVTVAAFQLDTIRDCVSFLLESERFEPVQPGSEPISLMADLATEIADDGAVTRRVTWSELDGAGISTRTEGVPNGLA